MTELSQKYLKNQKFCNSYYIHDIHKSFYKYYIIILAMNKCGTKSLEHDMIVRLNNNYSIFNFYFHE